MSDGVLHITPSGTDVLLRIVNSEAGTATDLTVTREQAKDLHKYLGWMLGDAYFRTMHLAYSQGA